MCVCVCIDFESVYIDVSIMYKYFHDNFLLYIYIYIYLLESSRHKLVTLFSPEDLSLSLDLSAIWHKPSSEQMPAMSRWLQQE